MRGQARAAAWAVSLFASLAAGSSQAADLIWEVESPFRFFKASRSFALHEAAFNAVRGEACAPSARSTIPTARTPRRPIAARRPPASAITTAPWAGRGGGDRGRDLLGEQGPLAPLRERVRAQIFLGHGERRLCPAGGAHGRRPHRARAARGRQRRLRLGLAAAQSRRQERDAACAV